MEEVYIEGSIDYIIKKLYEYKAEGKHVFCMYEGVRLDSDSISEDSSIIAENNINRESDEFDFTMDNENSKLERNRKLKGVSPITKDLVISGLKFICEHLDYSYDEIVDGLLYMGCNFNLEEAKEYGNQVSFDEQVKKDIKYVTEGALLISNLTTQDYNYANIRDMRIQHDDNSISIYHIVRQLTNDETYTKENITNKPRQR